MSMFGYTQIVIQKNKEADDDKIGVRLGRICIAKNVPAQTVANYFGVSRAAIYTWFSGDKEPRDKRVQEIEGFIATLSTE
jgi:transcriptional regulator with XRE-family HTH domain